MYSYQVTLNIPCMMAYILGTCYLKTGRIMSKISKLDGGYRRSIYKFCSLMGMDDIHGCWLEKILTGILSMMGSLDTEHTHLHNFGKWTVK